MKKSTGYKEMLRDRCPKVVGFALIWCNAKGKWIDHVYDNFIRIYVDKEERKNAARVILGLSKNNRNFDFKKTIDWENFTIVEEAYWNRVSDWVKWFTEKFIHIENTYDISISKGIDEFDIKVKIIEDYLSALMPTDEDNEEGYNEKIKYVNRLVDYLIKCIKSIR